MRLVAELNFIIWYVYKSTDRSTHKKSNILSIMGANCWNWVFSCVMRFLNWLVRCHFFYLKKLWSFVTVCWKCWKVFHAWRMIFLPCLRNNIQFDFLSPLHFNLSTGMNVGRSSNKLIIYCTMRDQKTIPNGNLWIYKSYLVNYTRFDKKLSDKVELRPQLTWKNKITSFEALKF